MSENALSTRLVGSWELISRLDRTRGGEQRIEPSLGGDPIAFLVFDRTGHFAAQFMRRDRSVEEPASPAAAANNSKARGGYDAYFGVYTVGDDQRMVRTRLVGALSPENVGQVFEREMSVEGDTLISELETTSAAGEALTRTLRWRRVG